MGFGGEPGMPGENCEGVSNVLIIQEGNDAAPGGNAGGGNFAFRFDTAVKFEHSLGLMDIDEHPREIEVQLQNGTVSTVPYQSLGDNSVQTVSIDAENAVMVFVLLPGSGAVTSPVLPTCL